MTGDNIKQSYAEASKRNISDSAVASFGDARNVVAMSVMCVVISVMKEPKVPDIFQETMNSLLKANNLPSFSLGSVTPPTMKKF